MKNLSPSLIMMSSMNLFHTTDSIAYKESTYRSYISYNYSASTQIPTPITGPQILTPLDLLSLYSESSSLLSYRLLLIMTPLPHPKWKYPLTCNILILKCIRDELKVIQNSLSYWKEEILLTTNLIFLFEVFMVWRT